MKFLVLSFVAFLIAASYCRDSFVLQPKSKLISLSESAINVNFMISFGGDIAVLSLGDRTLLILQRDSQGVYQEVGQEEFPFAFQYPITNGKHIGLSSEGYGVGTLETNFTIGSLSGLPVSFSVAHLFADGTLVGENTNDNSIVTFQYEQLNDTWNLIQTTPLNGFAAETGNMDFYFNRNAAFNGNYFFAVNRSEDVSEIAVGVFERQADLSWKLIESVQVANSTLFRVGAYNGKDTIAIGSNAVGDETTIGRMIIFSKVNGQWKSTEYGVQDLGVKPLGWIGSSLVFANENTLLVPAPLDGNAQLGYFNDRPLGSILVLTKNASGAWEPTADLRSNDDGNFGLGVNVVGNDIVTVRCDMVKSECQLYAAPLCIMEPINVTCHDQQLNDCAAINPEDLYTINNDPQCGDVSTTVQRISVSAENEVSVVFSFNKTAMNATCTAKIACPTAPLPINVQPTGRTASKASVVSLGMSIILGFFFLLV